MILYELFVSNQLTPKETKLHNFCFKFLDKNNSFDNILWDSENSIEINKSTAAWQFHLLCSLLTFWAFFIFFFMNFMFSNSLENYNNLEYTRTERFVKYSRSPKPL